MSYPVSREITDIRSEFEGGNSLSADFYAFLRRGANNVLDNVNPETLKRRTPIYGGIGKSMSVYYCPADLQVPSAIYTQPSPETRGSAPKYIYVPPSQFFVQNKPDTFTIEYINGIRFIIFRHSVSLSSITIDDMEAVGSKVSDQPLEVNDFNVFQGNSALERYFTFESGTAFTADEPTNVFTITGHGFANGDRKMMYTSGGTLPAGLSANTVYFVRDVTANTFKLALTSGGTAIDITTAGTGALYIHSATQNEISDTFTTPIDITDHKNGVVIIPIVLESAREISRIDFVLEQDEDNYYTMNSTLDSVGDEFIDGFNMARFKLSGMVETGNVTDTNILKWRLRIRTTGSTTQTVIVDKISIQKTAHYYIEYYSNRMFIDGTTGAWKETPESGDLINLNRDVADILHYETSILVSQSQTIIRTAKNAFDNLVTQLTRKYQQYWERHPSSEAPLTYNQLHDEDTDFPDYIGEHLQADMDIDYGDLVLAQTQFVDNETPVGVIDGVNATFTLTHVPNPANSLLLWLNGTYYTFGVDYTLAGNVITFAIPPSILFAGTPFVAFYRYSV